MSLGVRVQIESGQLAATAGRGSSG